jgi:hypothetical protein
VPGSLRTQQRVTVNSLLRTYPQYGGPTERFLRGKDSRYYSLQFKAEKSMSRGLVFTFGYNYSKESRGKFFNNIAEHNNQFTMIDTRDPRHYLRLAGTYELPFGKGRQFASNDNRVLDAIVGGWATSHIFMWNGGPLLTFGAMNATGDPTIEDPTRGRYFDISKFSVRPAYTPRTNPWYYDGLRGFGQWQWDATAVKYQAAHGVLKFPDFSCPANLTCR